VLAGRGDTESFVRLYKSYLKPVYRYVYARLGNRQEAEDVTSLAFERAWASLHSYRPTGSFKGWLFTIAHHSLVDYLRGRGRDRRAIPAADLAETVSDPASGPEESALASDQLRRVLATLARLGEEQQEVITLRFMAELPYAEIGRVMGKSEAAVKMIAYRALEAIKREHAND
jgi:RNA polymerase sigma-70 factor (ECF subfamily)